jgi:uncharacterized cupredoxin-like copper-binding protein
MAAMAAFALAVLVACGGTPAEEAAPEAEVTRIPTMSDAAAQATREAASAATPAEGAEATPGAAASPAATPVSEAAATAEGAATPVAGSATAAAEEAPAGETPAAAATGPVTVVSHDIFFDPKELTIPADTDVMVSLPNEGVTLHNFSIDALNIDVDIQPGATEEVVINAPAGTYEYYCNVPGHKAAGMVGTLTVG